MEERTRTLMAGRDPKLFNGAVNPPVERVSTLLLSKVSELYGSDIQTYGLDGMAVHRTLEQALLEIEGGAAVQLLPSGLAACTLPFLAHCKSGDHVLVTDSVYGPTRRFCDRLLKNMGVETTYFAPRIDAAGLAALIRPTTRLLFLESPGSLTFEIHDTRALAETAHAAGVKVAIDNTWSAGVFFKPFENGVDISIQALTKYQAGHADVLMGAILSADKATAALIRQTAKDIGFGTSPDEVYLALRGLRTMHVRLKQHDSTAREVAAWLAARPEVAQVLHPALPDCPDHALWKRENPFPAAYDIAKPPAGPIVNRDGKRNYVILDARGEGHYVGCNLSVDNLNPHRGFSWFGEGDDMIFVDGEEMPSITGTGTEDYFCYAWGYPGGLSSTPYHGVTVVGALKGKEIYSGKWTMFRFHVEDPIQFDRSIRVTMPKNTMPISAETISAAHSRGMLRVR